MRCNSVRLGAGVLAGLGVVVALFGSPSGAAGAAGAALAAGAAPAALASGPVAAAPTLGAGAAAWRWPVEGAGESEDFAVGGPRVLAEYRAPPSRYGAGHRGVDLTTLGGAVLSPREGVVAFAGVVGDRPLVVIEHPDGYRSSLEPVNPAVAVGDLVASGAPVGTLAAGGHCAGDCVHLGVRLRGEYLNPRALLGDIPRAVLLPLTSGPSPALPSPRR